ncbi:hypothetical protein Acr_21g0004640 [Actinidia rufa]|uniref:Uncharacterized protein n=1 Tax=Actinidia rufa TaxID=165716 RepID=A0A7J0GGG7_9ERIC|nr:hypothetical protein Acr_21g0004640 [Actinidia rufa]
MFRPLIFQKEIITVCWDCGNHPPFLHKSLQVMLISHLFLGSLCPSFSFSHHLLPMGDDDRGGCFIWGFGKYNIPMPSRYKSMSLPQAPSYCGTLGGWFGGCSRLGAMTSSEDYGQWRWPYPPLPLEILRSHPDFRKCCCLPQFQDCPIVDAFFIAANSSFLPLFLQPHQLLHSVTPTLQTW